MSGAGARSLKHQRDLIMASLVVVTAGAWAVTLRQASMLADMGTGAALPPLVFLAQWTAMMAAMMFPAAAPVLLAFGAVHADRRERGATFVSSWIFGAGYLLVWTAFGGAAYATATVAGVAMHETAWLTTNGGRLAGGLLMAAGLYQLSPLKQACLNSCRSPLAFFAASWREGRSGALRMGVEHGLTCLGCCWMLFLVLFPIGVMNLPAMGGLTVLVFIEKTLPIGKTMARLAAVGLVAAGALISLGALPLPGSM